MILGRESPAELIVSGAGVSARHAEIQRAGEGRYLIRDLGSTNGTFVNGRRITEATVTPDDSIHLGSTPLEWERMLPRLEPETRAMAQIEDPDRTPTRDFIRGPATLVELWRANLLRPAVVLLRALITLGAILGVLGILVASLPALDEGSGAGVLVLLATIVAVGLTYATAMVYPDLLAVLLRVEATCARAAFDLAPQRYPALAIRAGMLRILALAWLAIGLLSLVAAVLPGLSPWQLTASSGSGILPGWPALTVASLLACLVVGGRLAWERSRTSGWESIGLLPLLWAGAGTMGILLLWDGDLTRAAATAGWVWIVAGGFAFRDLVGTPWRREPKKIYQSFAVGSALVWVLVLGTKLLGSLAKLPMPVVELLGDDNRARRMVLVLRMELAEAVGSVGVVAVLMLLGAVMVAFLTWVQSDLIRSLIRSARSIVAVFGGRPHEALHQRVVRLAVTMVSALVVVVALAFILGEDVTRAIARYHWGRSSVSYDLVDQVLWALPGSRVATFGFALASLLGLWALVDLIRVSFDLEHASRSVGSSGSSLGLTSLRLLVAAAYVLGVVAGLMTFVGLGKGLDAVFGRLAGDALGTLLGWLLAGASALLVFVGISLVAALLRNALALEANTRPEGGRPVTSTPGYPGLSTLATLGKGLAITVAVLLTALGLYVASQANLGSAEVLIGLLVVLFVYWLLSMIPDSAILALSLERNLCRQDAPFQRAMAARLEASGQGPEEPGRGEQ